MIDIIYIISISLLILTFALVLLMSIIKLVFFLRYRAKKKLNSDQKEDFLSKKKDNLSLEFAIQNLKPNQLNQLLKSIWEKNLDFIKKNEIHKILMLVKVEKNYHIQHYHDYQINELLHLESKLNLEGNKQYLNFLFQEKKLYIEGNLIESFLAELFFNKNSFKVFNQIFIFPFLEKKTQSVLGYYILFKSGNYYDESMKNFCRTFIKMLNQEYISD